jgi:hypothetical protein
MDENNKIVVSDRDQNVYIYLGESKPDIVNYVIDYDIDYDSDLN